MPAPRYYFHYKDGMTHLDEKDFMLADPKATRAQAVISSAEMLKDLGVGFWDSPEWRC